MTHDAAFYFANLGADVTRCVSAAKQGDESRYQESLERAYHTADYIRALRRPEAHEEALLLLRGLAFARTSPTTLAAFQTSLDALIGVFSARLTV
jgi:hypothetical protein